MARVIYQIKGVLPQAPKATDEQHIHAYYSRYFARQKPYRWIVVYLKNDGPCSFLQSILIEIHTAAAVTKKMDEQGFHTEIFAPANLLLVFRHKEYKSRVIWVLILAFVLYKVFVQWVKRLYLSYVPKRSMYWWRQTNVLMSNLNTNSVNICYIVKNGDKNVWSRHEIFDFSNWNFSNSVFMDTC